MFVVDLARHHDGQDGLVGPFESHDLAKNYIDSLTDGFVRRYATIRPIHAPLRF
jgi:hypothetical protein